MILKNLFSKVTVDAFVYDHGIDEMFPIKESSNYLPQWWKKLSTETTEFSNYGVEFPSSTMKRCVGFTNFFKKSFTIPIWADVSISTDSEGKWASHSGYDRMKIESHSKNQYGDAFDKFIHLKFVSPWHLQDNKEINFLMKSASWNTPELWNSLFILDGIVDFKYQHSTHVNSFVNKIDQNIQINAGTPFALLIPLTEKKVKIKRHVISYQEYENMFRKTQRSFFFVNGYRKYKKHFDSK